MGSRTPKACPANSTLGYRTSRQGTDLVAQRRYCPLMGPGLSDEDRQKLDRERERVAARLAAERDRLEKKRSRAPTELAGPDGASVRISLSRSGVPHLGMSGGVSDPTGLIDLLFLLLAAAVGAIGLLIHAFVFHLGWKVLVEAGEHGRFVVRTRNRGAAQDRAREIADAVRVDGVAALQTFRSR